MTSKISINGSYLPFGWFILKQDPENLSSNIKKMQQNNVVYAFCNLGSVTVDGKYSTNHVRDLSQYIGLSRSLFPGQKIFAWLNGSTDELVTNLAAHDKVCSLVQQILNTNDVDGIHFDIEPMSADDPNLFTFMKKAKAIVGTKILSMATTHENWSGAFIAKMSTTVDLFAPMIYDSSTTLISDYQTYVCENSKTWLLNSTVPVLPTIPAYESNAWHQPTVENISTCVAGLQKAMNETKKLFQGYATWHWYEMTTDDFRLFQDKCLTVGLNSNTITYNNVKPKTTTIAAKISASHQWIAVNLTGVLGLTSAKIRISMNDRNVQYSYPADRNSSGLNADGAINDDFFSFKLLTVNTKINTTFTVEIISGDKVIYMDNLKFVVQ
jgi:hypothetical protein